MVPGMFSSPDCEMRAILLRICFQRSSQDVFDMSFQKRMMFRIRVASSSGIKERSK